jgi:Flp pilus assembly pilin Flp
MFLAKALILAVISAVMFAILSQILFKIRRLWKVRLKVKQALRV